MLSHPLLLPIFLLPFTHTDTHTPLSPCNPMCPTNPSASPTAKRPQPRRFVLPPGSWKFSEVHPSVGSKGRNERCLSLPISPRAEGQPWHEETEASASLCLLLLSPKHPYCPLPASPSVPAPLPGKDSCPRGSSGFSSCPSNGFLLMISSP